MKAGERGADWRVTRLDARIDGPESDPYFEWARATGFVHYGAEVEWLPLLVQLKGISAQAFATRVATMQRLAEAEQGWASDVQVPPFFATPPKRLKRATHVVALLMKRSLLEQVYDGTQKELAVMIRRIDIGRAGPPGIPKATSLPGTFVPAPGESKPKLVIAVIDDAIPFAHDRLRHNDGGTRVEFLWQMPNLFGGPPGLGREFAKRDPGVGLDDRIEDATHNGLVDEDEVYRRAGLTDPRRAGHQPLAARYAHGAHVADLACCDGPPSQAVQHPIVGVQLPAEVVADTSGASLEPHIFFGLFYALFRAETIAQSFGTPSLPLLANVSYGLIAGPHDGSGYLEAAVDQLLAACDPADARFHVLLPSGNSHLSRCHARFDLPAGGRQELCWRVLPDDLTESRLEIRLPAGADRVSIVVTPPDGAAGPKISAGSVAEAGTPGAAQALVHYPATPAPWRVIVTVMLAPTAALAGGTALAPAGLWMITLHHEGPQDIPGVHAWIQRDDTAPGFARRGRQSHFDDPSYARFDAGGRPIDDDAQVLTAASWIKREGTHNAIATGKRPLVVGAFRRSDGAASEYSAGGALPPPGRGLPSADGPEAMLPGDDSPSQRGVLGAGTRSGSCVALNGTSVATPLALRRLARAIVAKGPAGRQALFALAAAAEAAVPRPKPKPSAQRGGAGRLDEPSNRPPRIES